MDLFDGAGDFSFAIERSYGSGEVVQCHVNPITIFDFRFTSVWRIGLQRGILRFGEFPHSFLNLRQRIR